MTTPRVHHVIDWTNEVAWRDILDWAQDEPLTVVTLGEKAEKDGQYPSGKGYRVRKVPARVYTVEKVVVKKTRGKR